jgi:hypothetical protein
MNYLKPEVRVISAATYAIEGLEKPLTSLMDSITGLRSSTPSAYEADE